MKILVVTSYFSPHISGLTLYIEKLVKVLNLLGHSSTVLTNKHLAILKPEEQNKNLRIIRLPINFHISKSPFSLNLIPALFNLIPKHDLVILNLPSYESFFASPSTKLLGKKLLIIHHCDPIVPGMFGPFFTFVVTLLNFFSCIFANKIISYTKDYADHSPVLKFFSDKVIPVLPPVEISKPNPKTLHNLKIQMRQAKYKIGFAGRISQDKGVRYLLEAIPYLQKHLKSFLVIFAGPTRPIGENYYDSLLPLINKFRHNLIFLDSIPATEMVNFYKSINCLVLPSINRTESFGMVQIESMLSKTPVVATDIPGVRQVISLTKGGLIVPPQNPLALSQAINKILTNTHNFKPLHLEQFSLESYKQHFSRLLTSITQL